jgi:ribosomal protein S18 acetylase RimI-like enzyme/8-oxo-dGTP pyrophosphatase MutT (NUDIX family)
MQPADLNFREEMRGYHHGQSDMILFANEGGTTVGYVEYAVYQGEPSVQMLRVSPEFRRKGYGTAILKELQRRFPNTEIELGMQTEEGSQLVKKLNFKEEPTEFSTKFQELEKLQKEKEQLEAAAEIHNGLENTTEEERTEYLEQMERLNGVYDRIWELEQELRDKRPTKRLIAVKTIPADEVFAHYKNLHGGYYKWEKEYILGNNWKLEDVPLTSIDMDDTEVRSPEEAKLFSYMDTPFPPVILMHDGTVIDGMHRISAAKLRGDKTIRAYVPVGSKRFASARTAKFDLNQVQVRSNRDGDFEAVLNGKIIGYACVNPYREDSFAADERYIFNSHVKVRYRRKGVATLLYNAAENYLKNKGLKLVPSPALSDDAYHFWTKYKPEAVKDDPRRYKSQYMGKLVRYKDEDWIVENVNKKGFIAKHITRQGSNSLTFIPNEIVFNQLGYPDGVPEAKESDRSKEAKVTGSKVADEWDDMIPGAENLGGAPNIVPAPQEDESWYHGRRTDKPIHFDPNRPAFFTRSKDGAGWYSMERGDYDHPPVIGEFKLNIKQPARFRDLEKAIKNLGLTEKDIQENSSYDGINDADYLYVPATIEHLKKQGFDGYVAWDVLENTSIEIAVPFSTNQIIPIKEERLKESATPIALVTNKVASPQQPNFTWPIIDNIAAGFEMTMLDDGKKIGGTYVGVDQWQVGTGYATIRSSRISPQYRGQGFGKLLYDKTIEEAARRGITRLYADSDQTPEARHIWTSIAKRYPLKQDEDDPSYRYIALKTANDPDLDQQVKIGGIAPKLKWVYNKSLGVEISSRAIYHYELLLSLGKKNYAWNEAYRSGNYMRGVAFVYPIKKEIQLKSLLSGWRREETPYVPNEVWREFENKFPDYEIKDITDITDTAVSAPSPVMASVVDKLPPEPGTTPIPAGAIRCFHYTDPKNLDSIRQHGLLKSKGRGDDLSYSGPSAGVWASTTTPRYEDLSQRPYVEFYAMPNELSHNAAYPRPEEDGTAWGAAREHYVIMAGDVPPDHILAIHEPWHLHAKYYLENEDEINPADLSEETASSSWISPAEAEAVRWYLKNKKNKTSAHKPKPVPVPSVIDNDGWLTPEGMWFDCSKISHEDVAASLGFKGSGIWPTESALRAGYVRVVVDTWEDMTGYITFYSPEDAAQRAGEIIRRFPITIKRVEVSVGDNVSGYKVYDSLGKAEEAYPSGRLKKASFSCVACDSGDCIQHQGATDWHDLPIEKLADHRNNEGEYWAGENNSASGILPLCPNTGRIGLALRSEEVDEPGTYGTVGGAVIKGMSPEESAKKELKEETGYSGGIKLIPAYVFKDKDFKYFNFLGIVPKEFSLRPGSGSSAGLDHADETDHLKWVDWEEVLKGDSNYHFGLRDLLKHSEAEIRKIMIPAEKKSAATVSDNLKAWFGNSQVTDASGNPLRVFHGTKADFDEFSEAMLGVNTKAATTALGFFFTNKPSVASGFGSRVLPVYLKITNPFDPSILTATPIKKKIYVDRWGDSVRNKGQQPYVQYESHNDPFEKMKEAVWFFLTKNTKFENLPIASVKELNSEHFAEARKRLMSLGFDGIIIKDTQMDGAGKWGREHNFYIAFSPNQIKSATGNAEFNGNNPNITATVSRLGSGLSMKEAAGLKKVPKELETRIKTKPMDSDWKELLADKLRDNVTRPDIQNLRSRLLSYGGEEALITFPDDTSFEVGRLLQRGKFWLGNKAVLKKMQACRCHENSVHLVMEGKGELVNGYALSLDGLWRPHSWVLTSNGLIETTVKRMAYYGVVLTQAEIAKEYDAYNDGQVPSWVKNSSDTTPITASIEIIAADYMEMFGQILANPKTKSLESEIKQQIAWAKQTLKKTDRITWYLRWYRLYLESRQAKQLLPKDLANYSRKNLITKADIPQNIDTLKAELAHIMGFKDAPIQNKVFGYETPAQLKAEFDKLETQIAENADSEKRVIRQDYVSHESRPKDEIFIQFPDGWVWMLLDRAYCSAEASAMGHCGNSPRSQTSDRILSLRQPMGKAGVKYWSPHCTFILRLGGFLGEMKGRNNRKPISKYHPYILSLLKDHRIKGIMGGGYKPENNFHWNDLTQEQQNEVKDANPSFSGPENWEAMGKGDAALRQIAMSLGLIADEDEEIPFDRERDYFIVKRWNTVKAMVYDIGNSEAVDAMLYDNWTPSEIPDDKKVDTISQGLNYRYARIVQEMLLKNDPIFTQQFVEVQTKYNPSFKLNLTDERQLYSMLDYLRRSNSNNQIWGMVDQAFDMASGQEAKEQRLADLEYAIEYPDDEDYRNENKTHLVFVDATGQNRGSLFDWNASPVMEVISYDDAVELAGDENENKDLSGGQYRVNLGEPYDTTDFENPVEAFEKLLERGTHYKDPNQFEFKFRSHLLNRALS